MSQPEFIPRNLDEQSRRLRSSASLPVTAEGQPILPLDPTRKNEAAVQAFAISTADKELFRAQHTEVGPSFLPSVDQFQSVLNQLEVGPSVPPTRETVIAKIQELIGFAEKMDMDKLYTPFIGVEGQVFIAQYVQALVAEVREALNNVSGSEEQSDLQILSQPVKAEIVESVTRAFLYPSASPVNEPDDFDSGKCDLHLNTSFRRGDRGYIVATVGPYDFFMSDYGTYGWIDSAYAAATENVSAEPEEMFYVGDEPLFLTTDNENYVILPGDTIYLVQGQYVAKVRSANGALSFQPLPALQPEKITGKLDFSQSTDLQIAVDFLNNLQMPYMWSVFDCSEVVRRVFLMAGIPLGKYSGDMMADLGKISPAQSLITGPEGLVGLKDGMYVLNLLDLKRPPGTESIHMFFVVKKAGELSAFSYAFQIVGSDGQVEEPIGPHTCGIAALTQQLTTKGRQLAVTPIAV